MVIYILSQLDSSHGIVTEDARPLLPIIQKDPVNKNGKFEHLTFTGAFVVVTNFLYGIFPVAKPDPPLNERLTAQSLVKSSARNII